MDNILDFFSVLNVEGFTIGCHIQEIILNVCYFISNVVYYFILRYFQAYINLLGQRKYRHITCCKKKNLLSCCARIIMLFNGLSLIFILIVDIKIT